MRSPPASSSPSRASCGGQSFFTSNAEGVQATLEGRHLLRALASQTPSREAVVALLADAPFWPGSRLIGVVSGCLGAPESKDADDERS
jgi:hypothetical protein